MRKQGIPRPKRKSSQRGPGRTDPKRFRVRKHRPLPRRISESSNRPVFGVALQLLRTRHEAAPEMEADHNEEEEAVSSGA